MTPRRALLAACGRLFFACVLLAIPFRAHALGLEIGAGVAQYNHRPDGIWYQQGMPHSLGLRAPAFLIGAWGDVTPAIRWHLDFVDLGSVSVDSWDTVADSNYSTVTKQCLASCDSLMHLHGEGGVQGIAATLEGHTQGAWQIGIEGGPFLYHSTWSVQVPNFLQAAGLPANAHAAQVAPWGLMPGGVQRSEAGWALGGVIGLSLRHAGIGLSLRHYFDGRGWPMRSASGVTDGWPPIWTGQTVLMFTYFFH